MTEGLQTPDAWDGLTPPPDVPHIVLLGAGGPAGANFIRCMESQRAHLRVTAIDTQAHHLCMLPDWVAKVAQPEWDTAALARLRTAPKTLFVAQPDPAVALLSEARDELPCMLPGRRTIELAQDKAATAIIWSAAGLTPNRFATVQTGEDHVEARRRVLDGIGYPQWLRARSGAGARLACKADHRGQADLWCRFASMRFDEPTLLVEEFLPGRDYGITLLYDTGRLRGVMIRERLEYLYPQHAVSGRTGTPTAARLLLDEHLEGVAVRAVESLCEAALGEVPHGVYCVDLREDKHGTAVPTECNAGRFFTTSHAGIGAGLDLVGLYVTLANREHVEDVREQPVQRIMPSAHGMLVLRHIDMGTTCVWPNDITPEIAAWLRGLPTP